MPTHVITNCKIAWLESCVVREGAWKKWLEDRAIKKRVHGCSNFLYVVKFIGLCGVTIVG